MGELVTVAIPVRNGGPVLAELLDAVAAQALEPGRSLELVVCDSGSQDNSVALARSFGADVFEIAPELFSHGRTRNLLMERSRGRLVAFLTQDSVPAAASWLQELVAAFSLADGVGLAFGPYRPRPEASPMVARELTEWFASFSSPGEPRIDRLGPAERSAPARLLLGQRGFFTDANGCVSRAAWEQVPFRDVAYAEDHLLAHDMMRAGFAKVYMPGAAVVHSHEYSRRDWLRRSFDEARAMQEVYGWVAPITPRATALEIWGSVGADRRWACSNPPSGRRAGEVAVLLARSFAHHLARTTGAALGARAARLPPWLARAFSLERRDL